MLTKRLKKHLPSNWSAQSRSLAGSCIATEVTELRNTKRRKVRPEYADICKKVSGSFNEGIEKVERVENPFMYGHFLLKKAEYETRGHVKVVELFHDTAASKVDSIIVNNFDWRASKRVKFGRGVSFSPSPKYANKESSKSNGVDRAMIIADVLVGKKYVADCTRTIPVTKCDTAVGNRGQVYVKFDDNEFYPKYVVYYTSKVRQQGGVSSLSRAFRRL